MKFDPTNLNDSVDVGLINVPNGGVAVLDEDNKLVAYNKRGEPDGNDWDYVRVDCRRD